MLQINVNLLNNLNVIFIFFSPRRTFPSSANVQHTPMNPAVVMNMHNKFLIKINFQRRFEIIRRR